MIPILYIFETSSVPEEFNDQENVILLDKGFEGRDEESPISIDEIHFMTTIAVLSNRSEVVLDAFADWWKEKCGGDFRFQQLSSELEQLQDFRVQELKNLEEDEWSFKANFVAYCSLP